MVVPMRSTEDDGSAEICSGSERGLAFGTEHWTLDYVRGSSTCASQSSTLAR
jgi:hypothetical protein